MEMVLFGRTALLAGVVVWYFSFRLSPDHRLASLID